MPVGLFVVDVNTCFFADILSVILPWISFSSEENKNINNLLNSKLSASEP